MSSLPNFAQLMLTATGASASRALGDHFREVVNVVDEGAKANPLFNDTVPFTTANTKAALLGLPVFIPPGTYYVDPLSNWTQPIVGVSEYSTFIKLLSGAVTHMLRLADSLSGWSCRGVTFDSQGYGAHQLASSLASFIAIQNCQFMNGGYCALYITSAQNVLITDNYIYNCGFSSAGIAANSGAGMNIIASNAKIKGNTIIHTGGANISGNAYTTGGLDGYIEISGNYCSDAGSSILQDNITFYDSTNNRLRVFDNRCIGSTNHNIHVGGPDVEISGNHCSNAAQDNIICSSRISGTSTLLEFIGAKIIENTCVTAGLHNIELNGVSQVDCAKNTCRFATGSGILVSLTGTLISIDDNKIYMPATHGISASGLVDSGITNNKIVMPGTTNYGIVNSIGSTVSGTVVSSSNTIVFGNVVRGGQSSFFNTDGNATLSVALNISTGAGANTSPFGLANSDVGFGNLGGAQNKGFVQGSACAATAPYSEAHGFQASTKVRHGFIAYAGGALSVQGDAQGGHAVLRGKTNAGTTCVLTADGGAIGTHNVVNLNTTKNALAMTAQVVVTDSSGNTAIFEAKAAGKNISGTFSLVGTPSVTQLFADASAAAWALAVTADTTNLGLKLTVTAVANCVAVAAVRTAELGW
jgi:hypothetical protein